MGKKSQRFLERFAGSAFFLCFLPTLLLVALLIHVTAGGPVLVTDEWPSASDGMARCLRFRTTGRGTPFFHFMGRILRVYKVDDWPGFWSIGRGDISLREFLKLLRRE
jgi:lipopolysaccharide/colanic/teichoic acid biosynthesis glycosyltransferase